LCQDFHFNPEKFIADLNSPEYNQLTEQSFGLTQRFGVSGFPCLVAEKDNQYYLVCSGFRPKAEVLELIHSIYNSTQ
jgi:protein-disulfide isomerase-like protein with CxxC motif